MAALVFLLGIKALVFSLWAFFKFVKVDKKLSRAFAYMFLGEAIAVFITIVFAVLAQTGALVKLDGSVQDWLRIGIFLSAFLSSLNLYLHVNKIEK